MTDERPNFQMQQPGAQAHPSLRPKRPITWSSDTACTEDDERQRHRRPRKVKVRPSFRNRQLDYGRHQEYAQCCKARPETENEQDRQHDLGRSGERRRQHRSRVRVLLAENMQPEFLREQEDGRRPKGSKKPSHLVGPDLKKGTASATRSASSGSAAGMDAKTAWPRRSRPASRPCRPASGFEA